MYVFIVNYDSLYLELMFATRTLMNYNWNTSYCYYKIVPERALLLL